MFPSSTGSEETLRGKTRRGDFLVKFGGRGDTQELSAVREKRNAADISASVNMTCEHQDRLEEKQKTIL